MYNFTCQRNMYFEICTCTTNLNLLLHVLRSLHFLAVNCIIKHFLKNTIPITCSSSTVIIISYHLQTTQCAACAQTKKIPSTWGGSCIVHNSTCTCISSTVLQNFAQCILKILNTSIFRTVFIIIGAFCTYGTFITNSRNKFYVKFYKESMNKSCLQIRKLWFS